MTPLVRALGRGGSYDRSRRCIHRHHGPASRAILDRCTRCAKCGEVCPTAAPAGIDISEPAAIVGDVLDILRGGGDPSKRLDLESVREVLIAHMLGEQPLPVGFRGTPGIPSEDAPVRVIAE